MVSESLERKLEQVDVVNECLTSPHKAVRCTIKLQTSEQWISSGSNSPKCSKKLPEASGEKAHDKDKDDKQNLDLKQEKRNLEEGHR